MVICKCPVCNRELPEETNYCNFCGNKMKSNQSVNAWNIFKEKTKETNTNYSVSTAVVAIVSVGILCTLFAIVSPVFSKYIEKVKEVTSSQATGAVNNPVEYITISSTDLIACYKENQVNCTNLYDKKNLEVSGEVKDVGTNIWGSIYVCLGSDAEHTYVGIQCYAKDKATEDIIATLKKGDVITVRGKGNCGSLSFDLEKAEIVQ